MRLIVTASLAGALLLPSTFAQAQSFQAACKVQTLCAGVERGGGRMMACLREHRQSLSTACKLAIADIVLNRRGRGGADGDEAGAPRRFGRDDPDMERGAYAPPRGDRRDQARDDAYGEPAPDMRDTPSRAEPRDLRAEDGDQEPPQR